MKAPKSTNVDFSEYLTRDEVAAYTKLSVSFWEKVRDVPTLGIGSRVIFLRRDVDNYMLRFRTEPDQCTINQPAKRGRPTKASWRAGAPTGGRAPIR
jgi:hypothetical protein